MNRIEWPGIATAVGILLIGAIALDLSKWQPLLAALVALGGGTLAYQGAMAKIYADQEKDRREFQRKRLGVYLRTEHACDLLASRSDVLAEKTSRRRLKDKTVTRGELKITDLSDLDEAWVNLEMFPAALRQTEQRSEEDGPILPGRGIFELPGEQRIFAHRIQVGDRNHRMSLSG
jgi:hypothetical protein